MSSSRRRPTRTFVSLTGPAGNIGDALIRRETLEWARGTSDELVAYVGEAPDVWLHQLGVPTGTIVLRTKRSVPRWLWLLATAPRRPVLVLEAGEVPLDRGNGLRELVFLAETVIVRLKRGVVVRPPRGIRAPSNPALWLHALAARWSQVALWRDEKSAALVGGAQVVPDVGFAAGVRAGSDEEAREELIISLRGARPMPSAAWIEAVRAFARTEGLRIRTVVQVREDEQRSRELADALGGEFEPWGDIDAVTQERNLRARYDDAPMVISDRMHVLVLAALSGAVPVELVPTPTGKIAAAFDVIGLHGVSHDSRDADVNALTQVLVTQRGRRDEVIAAVSAAADKIAHLESRMRETVRRARR
ncbi:hypothetical protein [Microbacterium nymphoidis]|uniref:hypothetical protein n=1 Tax=Microbacterium nymphoidis TaxID=2898586 RepID=UPI001E4C1155|nr:hypothetical protein [Microbacterium nymphoidis]MCD2498726.1 hypothetical protein [Microbacterium nymphoidis]